MNTKELFKQRELILHLLFAFILLCFPALIFSQPNSGCNNPVQNGNNQNWSEECYLNSSCQEQGNPCTANDVRMQGIYVADINGNPLPVCEIGETTSVTLWGTFNNNTGTNRYAIRTRTEVWINNAFVVELNSCSFDVLASGQTDAALLGSFMYTCGDQIQLRYTWIGWNTSASQCSNPGGSDYNDVCGEYSPSKCSKELATISFLAPNFSYECGEAPSGSTQVCFTNLTVGGAPPVTYLWNFGDGATSTATNPCHTYLATTGSYTVSLTATGANGVDATVFQMLNLADLECCNPVCPPANVTISCTANTLPANPSLGMPTSTEGCGTITYSDVLNGSCPQILTRSWNSSTEGLICTQTITLSNVPPTVTCPANVTILCTANTLPVNTGTATTTDGCGGTSNVTFSNGAVIPGSCAQNYSFIRTWTATDNCGATATCTQTITVTNTPPMITCPANVTVMCTASTLPASTGTATATDNCGGTTNVTSTDGAVIPGSCAQNYSFVRTWTATDNCGSTATCTQTITVTNTPPMITCPANVTVLCTASTLPASTGIATATDNCGGTANVTSADGAVIPGSCAQNYSFVRTWTATDNCGSTATCTQTITVTNTPPMITCPANVTVLCTASTLPVSTGTATATDNCGGTANVTSADGVVIPGSCAQNYSFVRTWTATDNCGSTATCTQTITVTNTPPMITCPANVTVLCTASTLPASTGTATATDNCGGTTNVTSADGSVILGSCAQNYSFVRTWTATDNCGATATCTQTITVTNTPPSIICPPNITIECGESTDVINTGNATYTDGCNGTVNITHSNGAPTPGGCSNEYSFVRTFTATDNCGATATCTQTISIVDNTPPVIVCPMDLTIECTESTEPIETGSPNATDACDNSLDFDYSDEITPGDCIGEYTISRRWIVIDDCLNSDTCYQTISVQDNTLPICTTQNIVIDTVLDPSTGLVFLTPDMIDAGSYDECSGVSLEIIPEILSCEDEGENIVTLTVTDSCNNTSTCTAVVTLNCIDPCIEMNVHIYLEGATVDPNGGNSYSVPMRTTLNNLKVLPGQTYQDLFTGINYTPAGQPYTGAPWVYGGNEGDGFDSGGNPAMGNAGYPSTVVDWVLISLRDDTSAAPICMAAALVHNDGHVEFVEEFDCCELDFDESYFVVIEHRNHLIAMSDQRIPIDANSTITYDFRDKQSFIFDPFEFGIYSGQKEIIAGIYAMIAGNSGQVLSSNDDTDINFIDRATWEEGNSIFGQYRIEDHNMNGDTNFNDRTTWERNNGKFTSVPRD